MTSVQERLKLKRVPIDTWSVKEKLCLASAVVRSGDQNWMSVSRALRLFGEAGRPADWFSQKSCALQYGNLLENVDTPKRKKRTDKTGNEHVETPGEAIVRNLTHERISELKKLLQEGRVTYLKQKEEVAQIKAGQADDRLGELRQHIEEEEKQKERDAEAHKRWLQERQEKKIELERAWKPPVTPASPLRQKKAPRGTSGNRRNSSQSEQSSEAETVDSPAPEQLNVDVVEESVEPPLEAKPMVPTTPTSPLLTSLLKSPSPAPSQSSILHSAITSVHHRVASSNPTIASLLHSAPGIPSSVAPPPATVSSSLKNLVTSAIGAASVEEAPKPPSTSPAAGAPTLSMLLELPPSLPGKPLPELPVTGVAKPPSTTKAPGEVCHPQHQEMRMGREVVTDEPVEVVEVEQHIEPTIVPNLRDQVVGMEVVVGMQDAKPLPETKLIDEDELEVVTQVIADVTKMEEEEAAAKAAAAAAAATQAQAAATQVAATSSANVPMPDIKEKPEVLEVEDSAPDPAEVVEVPAQNDLDIIIVDGSSLGGQEEVPTDPDCQLVEIVLNDKNAETSKPQEAVPVEPVLETTKESNRAPSSEKELTAQKVDIPKETKHKEIDAEKPAEDEGRIEVLAIEMSTRSEESSRETTKEKLKSKELDKEVGNVKDNEENEEVISVEKKEEKAVSNEEPGQPQVDEDVHKEEESKQDKDHNVTEIDARTSGENEEEEAANKEEVEEKEEKNNEIEDSHEGTKSLAEEKQEDESDEVLEKPDEATEEEDSQAESGEDEKKAEKPSTGGKAWKMEDVEEIEEKEKASSYEKPSPDKNTTQKPVARAETPSTEDDKTNDALEPPRSSNSRRRLTPIDSVPNSPAAPLTEEDREYRAWKKAIMLVYGRLATHKYASLFLRPITDDQAPGYSSIVHRPIDLLTIKKNIETGVTRSTAEFQRDVMLMFLNSIMYNKSSHFVHKMAKQMQQEGMQHIQDFLTTQMLVQVSGEAPLRRETRTTEANKQRDIMSAPGSSDDGEGSASKRKRPEPDRSSIKKRKLVVDE